MPDARTMVLITGFGPFPGVPENATMRLVPALVDRARKAYSDIRIEAEILPTEWRVAPARLDALYRNHKPDVALHFGVSSRARGFEIEARGRNVRALASDACGELPDSICIAEDGPDLSAATLPVVRIVDELRRMGLAAFVSRDAGTYLCNALLYTTLDVAAQSETSVRAGFIHIPASLANVRDGLPTRFRHGLATRPSSCPLTWPQTIDGALAILRISLGRTPLMRRCGGS
jgi:pyroglutamyl-peptidase